MNQQITALENQRSEVQNQVNQADNRLSQSENQLAEQQKQVKALQEKLTEATNQVNAAQEVLDGAKKDLANLNEAALKQQLVTATAQLADTQKLLTQTQDALAQAQQAQSKASQTVSELTPKVIAANQDLAEKQQVADQTAKKLADTQAALNQANQKIASLQQQANSENKIVIPQEYKDHWENCMIDDSFKKIALKGYDVNHYVSNEADRQMQVIPSQLTDEQMRDLTLWTAALLNTARDEMGVKSRNIVTDKSMQFGRLVAKHYLEGKGITEKTIWGHFAHDMQAWSTAAKETGEGYHNAESLGLGYVNRPNEKTTMDNLKRGIYRSILDMLFNDATSQWGHANHLTGMYTKEIGREDDTFFGLGITTVGVNNFENYFVGDTSNIYPLVNDYAQLQQALSEAKAQQAAKQAAYNKAKQANDTAQAEVTKAKETANQANQQLAVAKQQLAQASQKVQDSQAKVAQLQNQLKVNQNAKEQAQQALKDKDAALATKQAAVTKAQENLQAALAEKAQQQALFNEASQQESKLAKQVQSDKEALLNIYDKLDQLNQDQNTAIKDRDAKEATLSKLDAKLSTNKADLQALNKNMQLALADKEDKLANLASARKVLAEKQAMLSALDNQLAKEKALLRQLSEVVTQKEASLQEASEILAKSQAKLKELQDLLYKYENIDELISDAKEAVKEAKANYEKQAMNLLFAQAAYTKAQQTLKEKEAQTKQAQTVYNRMLAANLLKNEKQAQPTKQAKPALQMMKAKKAAELPSAGSKQQNTSWIGMAFLSIAGAFMVTSRHAKRRRK